MIDVVGIGKTRYSASIDLVEKINKLKQNKYGKFSLLFDGNSVYIRRCVISGGEAKNEKIKLEIVKATYMTSAKISSLQ